MEVNQAVSSSVRGPVNPESILYIGCLAQGKDAPAYSIYTAVRCMLECSMIAGLHTGSVAECSMV